MRHNVLLTLGRLPKALELARALHAAGCRVIVADPFGLHLCRASRAVAHSVAVTAPNADAAAFRADLERIIEGEGVDKVIGVSEEVVHVAHALKNGPYAARLYGPPFEVLVTLHDKAAFNALARTHGLPAPRTVRAGEDGAAALLTQTDCVLKPALGCAGAGLVFADRGDAAALDGLSNAILVQERLYGREVSALAIADNGHVQGLSTYVPRVTSGTVAVAFERVSDAQSVEDWVRRFVAATGHSGFVAFDFIVDDAGTAWPLECNPRLTSGVHFFDPAGLASALLDPAGTRRVGFKPQARFQEGHTALALAYGTVFHPRTFVRRFGAVFSTRDIKWAARDPLPFLFFTTLSAPVLRRTLFGGMTLAEAATQDIEWAA